MISELRQLLRLKLNENFTLTKNHLGQRALILASVAEDMQVGFVIQKTKRRNISNKLVDIGARVPSVEAIYDEYEIERMREMGFRDRTPVCWLTFWRPSYSSLQLEESGLTVDAILQDFVRLYDSIMDDVASARAAMLELLSNARRPSWATAPGSTMLIIKGLIVRALHDPEVDACAHVEKLIANEPHIEGYEAEIDRFCDWLRLTYYPQI